MAQLPDFFSLFIGRNREENFLYIIYSLMKFISEANNGTSFA